jgi:BirA family biotin operon repressor/biotin-[acetyl-CoA-carboxylase] ligase
MTPDWLAIDPLDAAAIRSELRTRELGRRLEVHRLLSSTVEQVRRLARAGAPPGTVAIAEEQTAGRGRRGRVWSSAAGLGLWLSALVRVDLPSPGLLTLSAAVAVRRGIAAAGGHWAAVKWPNDLELGGRKVCGILVEATGEGGGALGIGINVHHAPDDFPAELADQATSLDREMGRTMCRNALAVHVLEALEAIHDELDAGRGDALLDEWRRACAHLGRRVQVTSEAGSVEGVTLDIDRRGALLVRRDSGEVETVMAGSLRLVGSA